ncbi:MAG: ABC transporter ATP-binding protein [Clostridia bacterium]|nr:ABC transporter ATP-binding protein [Clostridia bacterium]
MLEIKELCSGYGKKQVLNSVSLELEKGRLISVVGPNGSGKSTLLKPLVGINRVFSGDITVDGIPLSSLTSRERARKISYLSQGMTLPDMTVEEVVLQGRFPHLSYPCVYTEQDKELSVEAMRRVGILPLAQNSLSSLSGGMRQSVFIAMALAQNTDYILLDEPLTYLDVSHQAELMRLLKELAEEGRCVVTVTHDLPLAFNFSDSVAVISNGSVLLHGAPCEACENGCIDTLFGVQIINTEYGYILNNMR